MFIILFLGRIDLHAAVFQKHIIFLILYISTLPLSEMFC